MFTGIVEKIGTIKSARYASGIWKLGIASEELSKELKPGESVSVNGVCLTVTEAKGPLFFVDVTKETYSKTNLGSLKASDTVNLERALKLSDRLSGHLVSGHIDSTGTIKGLSRAPDAVKFTIAYPVSMAKYIVGRGSVAVDGISLTVSGLARDSFTVNAIPFTLNGSILGRKKIGDKVNLEFDLIGKYAERLISGEGFVSCN